MDFSTYNDLYSADEKSLLNVYFSIRSNRIPSVLEIEKQIPKYNTKQIKEMLNDLGLDYTIAGTK